MYQLHTGVSSTLLITQCKYIIGMKDESMRIIDQYN